MNWQSRTFFFGAIVVAAAWAGACGGAADSGTGSGASSGTTSDGGNTSEGGTGNPTTGNAGPTSAGGGGDSGSTDTPTVCTSQQTWARGDRGSQLMHPGGACITCHDSNDGPSFSIAGTVYPTAHEPDDCDGVSGAVQVVITDANNQTTTLTVNSAGNFYSAAHIATPFRAKVVSGTRERVMADAQTSGDCNSCHTVDGANSAPGRIMAP